jgi:hypothetical protein
MAIFSKKNSVKRSENQAKVILDESLEGKPVENASDREQAAVESSAPESAATDSSGSPSSTVEPAANEPATAKANTEAERTNTDHHGDDIEPESIETPPVVPIEHRFGIDDAIQLMRSLPADPNSALVVRVVRVTLAAVNVSVEEIVADATRKETRIKESISALEAKIVELEGQLGALRRDISAHQADLKETVNVRERLHLADQYQGPKPPPTPVAATLARLSASKPISS